MLREGNVIHVLNRLVKDFNTGVWNTDSLNMIGWDYEVLSVLTKGNLVLSGVGKSHLIITSPVENYMGDEGLVEIKTRNTLYIVTRIK